MNEPVLFDRIEELLCKLVDEMRDNLQGVEDLMAVRDLFGRVRFLVETRPKDPLATALQELARQAKDRLGRRAYPPQQALLYCDELATDFKLESIPRRLLHDGPPKLWLIDRQVTGRSWGTVNGGPGEAETPPQRFAFYSLKGGVGRSTAAAVVAWHLAGKGRNVLVLDLDLEAPGLSTSLLPPERQPEHGIVDWLVEDAVGQGDAVLRSMVGTSPLAVDLRGEIWVVPAHGGKPGDYLAKLGRCYLDLPREGSRETWEQRIVRLVGTLEHDRKPDIVLLDARAGLQDLSSVAVTDLNADVFLFAIDSAQTWSAYQILFEHWQREDLIRRLRERLQIVAALVPETGREPYLEGFRQKAWDLFRDHAYDAVEPSEGESDAIPTDAFTFDLRDDEAPHAPAPIYWNRGLATLGNLHALDETLVAAAFGAFLDRFDRLVAVAGEEEL